MESYKGKTIFVGLSGGVDSSVAAARLLDAGARVIGVFIRVWRPDFIHCDEEKDRLDAMRVAAHLGIPFRTFDAREVYRRKVAEHMIDEYKKGRTPNPDVLCNQFVKFGIFLKYAKSEGADGIATGHYAQNDGHLRRGSDLRKDQSYFLWALKSEDLSFVSFPVGDSTKQSVRHEAARRGLQTADKRDSQGVCMLGEFDMKDFLSHYVKEVPGDVLDANGEVIGEHDGAEFYTIGQRHGFRVNAPGEGLRRYVTRKDVLHNTLTVEPDTDSIYCTGVMLSSVNLFAKREEVTASSRTTAVFRYQQNPFLLTTIRLTGRNIHLSFDGIKELPSPGQSCVLYEEDRVLAGGIIDTVDLAYDDCRKNHAGDYHHEGGRDRRAVQVSKT